MNTEPQKKIKHEELKAIPPRPAPPWESLPIQNALPDEYKIDYSGVAILIERKKGKEIIQDYIKFSGPVWVSAITRQPNQENYGSVVEWINLDGKHLKQPIPHKAFHDPKSTIAQDLSNQGLRIVPGKHRELIKYLESFSEKMKTRNQSIDQVGWLDDTEGKLSYVLPSKTISKSKDQIIFQPERYSPSSSTIYSQGSLDDWQEHVCAKVADEPYMLFALFAGFVGPLLKFSSVDGGGFHFYQRTSRGKTTAVQIAASIWGCGADPAIAPSKAFIQKWNSTANALESTAAAHNDNLLVLDEIGTYDAKNFGKVVYDLAGGTGKARLNASSLMKKQRTWRILVLSTGEESIEQKLENSGTAKGGQMIRFCDIPIADSLVLNEKDPSKYVDSLKASCSTCFGTAGPAFLQALVDEYDNALLLKESIDDQVTVAFNRLVKGDQDKETARLGKRFALVEVAGRLACNLLSLPVSEEQIEKAMDTICSAWLDSPKSINDSDRLTCKLRDFITSNFNGKFANADKENEHKSVELAGFYTNRFGDDNTLYLFTKDQLSRACGGQDPTGAARELRDKGFLDCRGGGKNLMTRLNIPAMGNKRVAFYLVKQNILESDNDVTDLADRDGLG